MKENGEAFSQRSYEKSSEFLLISGLKQKSINIHTFFFDILKEGN